MNYFKFNLKASFQRKKTTKSTLHQRRKKNEKQRKTRDTAFKKKEKKQPDKRAQNLPDTPKTFFAHLSSPGDHKGTSYLAER